ncbi:MAG: hypothetical protein ACYS0H_04815, partial [Planctomycetota bacterium]
VVWAAWLKSPTNVVPILILLLAGTQVTLSSVAVITSASLVVESGFLKYKYLEYRKRNICLA